ncbi:MAG: hypothetical protein GTO63_24985 [Anaerolineae bacterium]|nr:hypothetical protein [Anaerolineae bacterium]NIN97983.1 hypothetical protein [Anaerolineae bacterium]
MQYVPRALVRGLDLLLRRHGRVQEFTQDDECILRISLTTDKTDVQLSDGTRVRAGDRICELHLWNEHIPSMPVDGPDLLWGVRFYRLAVKSLRSLAAYMETDGLQDVVALGGQMAFLEKDDSPVLASVASQLGFDVVNLTAQAGRWGRFTHFWENVFSWALMWTYNPGSLRGKRFLRLQRYRLWMSRRSLLGRYGQ